MKQITTSDLRIGNWLFYSKSNKFPMQVEVIGKDYIYLNFEGNKGDSLDIESEDICPILLTKELIVKSLKAEEFDFEYSVDLGDRYIYFKINNDNDKSVSLYTYDDMKIIKLCDDINYFHELQNLYYALTGKELEIKREWL